jgi:DNA-binding MarR family transcriptional regulator
MNSDETRMTNEPNVEDWELLAQVAQAYRALTENFMDGIGMHRAQAGLLCRLYVNNGMTQSELADQLAVQGATITNILQRMEDAGLVARRRDPDDNRLVRVYLTEAGREHERAITQKFFELEAAVFDGIGETERVRLRGLLRQMLTNMAVRA